MNGFAIWWFAFGYFACYVPYSALTKAVSKGAWPGLEQAVNGFALLPMSVLASVIGTFAFITAMRWWRYVPRRRVLGVSVPVPGKWLFLSGLCTGAVVVTTTLAYTFDGISIVFVMLLMRGGVLVLAPIVDKLTGRRTRWFSWAGLGLSLGALLVAFAEEGGTAITLVCAVDVAVYLAAYFIRFRFMSRLAKSADPAANRRFFVQEQLVATPALLLFLAVLALIGEGPLMSALRDGFTEVPAGDALIPVLMIGFLSQGTGIFGTLVFLDAREHTYCVPINRSSSILAGVVATWALWAGLGLRPPSAYELGGAVLILAAILFLTIPPALEKKALAKKALEAQTAEAAAKVRVGV